MSFGDQILHFLGLSTRQEKLRKKLNVQLDGQVFMQICRILLEQAPKGSQILIMEARMPFEQTATIKNEMDCYIQKSAGKDKKFMPSMQAEDELYALLDQVRDSMVEQKHPRWKGIKMVVDVPGDKYNADFKY